MNDNSKPPSPFAGIGKAAPAVLLMLVVLGVGFFGKRHLEKLGNAPSQPPADRTDRAEITITLEKSGDFLVDSATLTPTELNARFQKIAEKLPNQTIIVRAGKGTDLKQVMAAIEKIKKSGIPNVAFSTTP